MVSTSGRGNRWQNWKVDTPFCNHPGKVRLLGYLESARTTIANFSKASTLRSIINSQLIPLTTRTEVPSTFSPRVFELNFRTIKVVS